MKAITIKQPWAGLIVFDIKDIENRTWKTNFRGRVYVHASQINAPDFNFTLPQSYALDSITDDYKFIRSAIIGEVDIIDCVQNHPSIWAEHTAIKLKNIDGKKVEVHVPVYNWVLANPIKYAEPILNIKGSLSFWEFNNEGR